jgi:hypothetical protein
MFAIVLGVVDPNMSTEKPDILADLEARFGDAPKRHF